MTTGDTSPTLGMDNQGDALAEAFAEMEKSGAFKDLIEDEYVEEDPSYIVPDDAITDDADDVDSTDSASASGVTDTTITTTLDTDPDPDPAVEVPGEVGSDGGVPPVAPSGPSSSDDPTTDTDPNANTNATPTISSWEQIWTDRFGQPPTPEGFADAIQLVHDIQSWPEEVRARVERALAGHPEPTQYPQQPQPQYPQPPYPQQPYPQPQPYQPHPGTPPAAVAPGTPAAPGSVGVPGLPDEYLEDSVIVAWYQAQQAQQQQLAMQLQAEQAERERIAQIQQEQYNAQVTQASERGRARFRSEYPELTDDQYARVYSRAKQNAGNYQTLVAQYGDPEIAVTKLLEGAMESLPDVSKEIYDRRLQARVDQALAEREQRNNASALAGAATAAPTRSEPTSREEEDNAMIAMIAESMGAN